MKARPSDPPIKKIVFPGALLSRFYRHELSVTEPWDFLDEDVDAEHLDGDHWLVLAKPNSVVWKLRANIVRVKGKKVLEILGKPH